MTPEERRLEIIAWAPGNGEYIPQDGTFDETGMMPRKVYQRLIALAVSLASESDASHD